MCNAFSINSSWRNILNKLSWPSRWPISKKQVNIKLALKPCNSSEGRCLYCIKNDYNNLAVNNLLDKHGPAAYAAINSSNPEQISDCLHTPESRLVFLLLAQNKSNSDKLFALNIWHHFLLQPELTGAASKIYAANYSLFHFLSICADNTTGLSAELAAVVKQLQQKFALDYVQSIHNKFYEFVMNTQAAIDAGRLTPSSSLFRNTYLTFMHVDTLYQHWLDAHAKVQDATPSAEIAKVERELRKCRQWPSLFANVSVAV